MMMTVNTTNNGEFSEDGKPGSRADGLPKAAEDPMNEPTIRFTIDPALLRAADQAEGEGPSCELEDTYVGEPLLPAEEKPVPRIPMWVRIAMIAAVSVALLIGAAAVAHSGPSAAETVEMFLSALDTSDYEALSAVAGSEGAPLTAESVKPLFELYRSDPAFREKAAGSLRLQASGKELSDGVFRLTSEKHLLRRDYRVEIAGCSVEIASNLAGATITMGAAAATTALLPADGKNGAAGPSRVRLDGVLPGIYTVSGSYTGEYGETFRAESVAHVSEPGKNDCAVDFEYTSLEVFNDSDAPVSLSVGGSAVSMQPAEDLVLCPIAPDTRVVAERKTDSGESLKLSARAEDGYFYVSFVLCRLEIYNDYGVPLLLSRNGKSCGEIKPGGMTVLDQVPSGNIITATLKGHEELGQYSYQAAFDYDYLYPVFSLPKVSADQAAKAAEDYVALAYETYAEKPEALPWMTDTALTRDLSAIYDKAAQSAQTAPELQPDPVKCALADDLKILAGTMTVTAGVTYTCASDGDGAQECSYRLPLLWDGTAWNVQSDVGTAKKQPS